MNTSILYTKEIWSDDTLYKLSIDSKLVYFYFLCGPERNYLTVLKLRKRFVSVYTGLNETQVGAAIEALVEKGFIEIYEDYVGIKKMHIAKIGGPYGAINTERELNGLPENVRAHFYPNNKIEVVEKPLKKNKTGPAPETIKTIIAKQPEELRAALNDFVEDRIERKKAPTTRAVKGWINKLESMYPGKPDKQAESLYQSIERGWMGLFEVKNDVSRGNGEFL